MALDAGPLAELNELLAKTAQADECSEILCALLHLISRNVKEAKITELSVELLEAAVGENIGEKSGAFRMTAVCLHGHCMRGRLRSVPDARPNDTSSLSADRGMEEYEEG